MQNLVLAIRKWVTHSAVVSTRFSVGEPRTEGGVDITAAGYDVLNRLHELGAGRLLQEVAVCTGGERLANVARVVLHREDEDSCAGRCGDQVGNGRNPTTSRHDDVE